MMSTQFPWISPLGLKPEEVEHWKMQLEPGQNLTFWALAKGLINWPQYQQWAMEYYKLPSVNDDYFREPASAEFWQLIRSVANWSPSLLPLEQWDGTIFIGCVEPPSANVTWSFPVQFVLASPTSLKLQWQKYHAGSAQVAAPVPAPSASPEVSATPEAVEFKFDMDALMNPSPPSEDAPPPPPEPEAPEGFAINADGAKKVELAFDVEVPTGPATPEGMINELEKTVSNETIRAGSILPDLPDADVTAVVEIPVEPTLEPVTAPPPIAAPAAKNASMSLDDVRTEEEAMFWAFNEMKKYFDQSMFLKFENNEFMPLHWSDGWQPKPGAEKFKIGIDTPNLFRIIARTKHVYHGKIVQSPVHQLFFQNWGMVGFPDMATAIPVSLRGELKGVLLSVGPESSIEGHALEHAEKVATRLQQKWDEITNPGKVKAS